VLALEKRYTDFQLIFIFRLYNLQLRIEKQMSSFQLETGQIVYDPRGVIEAEPKSLAPRLSSLEGLRLGILDNSKWNGGNLLRKVVSLLEEDESFAEIRYYKKESFSKNATPELIDEIALENDAVITAIGD